MNTLRFTLDRADAVQVENHLRECDGQFVPPLSARVDLEVYARKIATRTKRFEAWSDGTLVGLVAAYIGDSACHDAHITNVSVLPAWAGQRIAGTLLGQCIENARRAGSQAIKLEVSADNSPALRLYLAAGFQSLTVQGAVHDMRLQLREGQGMNKSRDYNIESQDS